MSDESRGGERGEAARLDIKIPEELAGGVYANNMIVSHTHEEFVLDFMSVFNPRAGVVTARVVVSPGHAKRIVRALAENLARFEARFGAIPDAPPDEGRVH
jgi:uncharacterized protein DUF3467